MLSDMLVQTMRPLSFIPHEGEWTAVTNGCVFRLNPGERPQRRLHLGTLEPEEARLVAGYPKSGDTFVDAGAHIGYFAGLAARCVGDGFVRENQLRQVTLHHGAPGDHARRVNPGASLTTLDALAKQHSLDFVDLPGVEAKGHEPAVLAGAARLMAERRIGAIYCEVGDDHFDVPPPPVAALLAEFLSLGFHAQRSSANYFFTKAYAPYAH